MKKKLLETSEIHQLITPYLTLMIDSIVSLINETHFLRKKLLVFPKYLIITRHTLL